MHLKGIDALPIDFDAPIRIKPSLRDHDYFTTLFHPVLLYDVGHGGLFCEVQILAGRVHDFVKESYGPRIDAQEHDTGIQAIVIADSCCSIFALHSTTKR